MKIPARSLSVLLIPALGACHGPLNQSISPGLTDLPAIADAQARDQGAPATGDVQPSLQFGQNRMHWPLRRFAVSINRTEHVPTYDMSVQLRTLSARQRGAYPTARWALQPDVTDWVTGVEAVVNAGLSTAAVPAMPVRMALGERPGDLGHSPARDYQRVPPEPREDLRRWFWPFDRDDSMSTEARP